MRQDRSNTAKSFNGKMINKIITIICSKVMLTIIIPAIIGVIAITCYPDPVDHNAVELYMTFFTAIFVISGLILAFPVIFNDSKKKKFKSFITQCGRSLTDKCMKCGGELECVQSITHHKHRCKCGRGYGKSLGGRDKVKCKQCGDITHRSYDGPHCC